MPFSILMCYFFGFVVQVFPITFLCYLPYKKENFRIQRKATIFFAILILLTYAAIESTLLVYMEYVVCVDQFYMVAKMFRFAFIILIVSVYIYSVKEEFLKKIIVFILAFIYSEIIAASPQFWMFFTNMKINNERGIIYTREGIFVIIGTTILTYPFMLVVMKKTVKPWLTIMTAKTERWLCLFLVIQYFLYLTAYWSMCRENVLTGVNILLFTCLTLTVIMVLIMFFNVSFQIDHQRKLQEWYDMEKHQMEMEQLQYQNLIENFERTRRFKHDVRHHMRLIRSMAEKIQAGEILEYLNEYEEKNYNLHYDKVCNNFIVNSIARYYFKEARENGIEVTHKCYINDDIDIDKVTLTSVFANILENAIESCEKCQNIEKQIKIKAIQDDNLLVILMENSCEEINGVKDKNGYLEINSLFSTKRDGKKHGVGLVNVLEIASNTNGTARFKYENNTFYTEIGIGFHMDS